MYLVLLYKKNIIYQPIQRKTITRSHWWHLKIQIFFVSACYFYKKTLFFNVCITNISNFSSNILYNKISFKKKFNKQISFETLCIIRGAFAIVILNKFLMGYKNRKSSNSWRYQIVLCRELNVPYIRHPHLNSSHLLLKSS